MADDPLKKKPIPPSPSPSPSWIAIGITMAAFWPVGAFLLFLRICNWGKRKRYDHYREIVKIVGERAYIRIKDLARTLGRDVDVLRMDLRSMISSGYLGRKAYLDMSTGCLVVDPDARPDGSVDAQVNKAAEKEARKPATPKPEPMQQQDSAPPPEQKSYAQSEDEFEKKLMEIQDLNDRIADEAVSQKIDRIGQLTASIFRFAKERPDRRDEIRKFLNYYLPTTFKLLESYALLEKQSYQGENITSARREIENIMDSLVKAFEQQLDRLFRADAMDISSDIEVLETMMAKDGLSEKRGMTLGGHS